MMKGIIRSYLPEKKYGFIEGSDGKAYFFHENEFRNRSQIAQLCEQAIVEFDQQATPRGYKARNCILVDASQVPTYTTPDEFIASRSSSVRGWEIIERGNWIVHGTSCDSPDSARQAVRENAMRVGANALVELHYYKTTGSEAGTGWGTHHFTIHNYRGRIVTLAKRTASGRYTASQLAGLNQRAELLKTHLVRRTTMSKRNRNLFWLVVIVLSLLSLGLAPAVSLILLLVGLVFGRFTDYDCWLQRA
ncbi:MAG TPA: cold shock domain-containing protein [Steroidobacter sp.]|uniref:cold shock domain-containing protein n=1 Tax=Steroidobacter sp. TaxID=1978227 RepID=UPI002EDA6BF1